MQTLTVELGQRSYPIYIGEAILNKLELLKPHITGSQVMIISNETIASLYLAACEKTLVDYQVNKVILPDGERYKTLATWQTIFDDLLAQQHVRSTTLLALGGGVVGDITGFAAACYMRGVNYIQVPTTLLAQVDSAVGGKTAVNHPAGKNMIGAFYQPSCVLIDTTTLQTLPEREYCAGLAEVIKYGLIRDAEFWEWLQDNMPALLARDSQAVAYMISRSCQNKADIVAADERESGQRALLNYGHTFAHALETMLGYGEILHGEAVAIGMLVAAQVSEALTWLSGEDVKKLECILKMANLPTKLPKGVNAQHLLPLMKLDKKVVGSTIRLVLLQSIGHAVITDEVGPDVIERVLRAS